MNCSLGDIIDTYSVAICLLLVHRIDCGILVTIDEEAVGILYLGLSFVVGLGGAFFTLGPLRGYNHFLHYYFSGITVVCLSTRDEDNGMLNCLIILVLMVLLNIIYEICYLE